MVGIIFRGRPAWIAASIFGLILLIIGLVINVSFLTFVGGAFLVLGLIFLIISFATHGQSD